MKSVKQIPRPDLNSARKLTPLEMNAVKCDSQHSLLNRERLDQIASQGDPKKIS